MYEEAISMFPTWVFITSKDVWSTCAALRALPGSGRLSFIFIYGINILRADGTFENGGIGFDHVAKRNRPLHW